MTDSIRDVLENVDFSTKKKNQKENIRKALSLKEKESFRVAQHPPKVNDIMKAKTYESQKPVDNQDKSSRINARKNAELDEYLLGLLMEGIIDEAYWKFHTKCLYVLGLDYYNKMVVEARSGRTPKNLLAFKLKGALELHYKKQLYRQQHNLEP